QWSIQTVHLKESITSYQETTTPCAPFACSPRESPTRLSRVIRLRPKAAWFRRNLLKTQRKAKPRRMKALQVERWRRSLLHPKTITAAATLVAGKRNPHPGHHKAQRPRRLKARPMRAPNLSWRRAKR